MRARDDPTFNEYLLRIGNGTEEMDSQNWDSLPSFMIIPQDSDQTNEHSVNQLLQFIFPDLSAFSIDPILMMNSVLLTPKNDCVDEINDLLISKFQGTVKENTEREYISIDKTLDPNEQRQYEDYLNSLSPNGFPPHKLRLKKTVLLSF